MDSLESDTKTPHKMRVLLAVAALFVAGASAGGKEYQEMKMWMKMKAMEGCLGEDVMKAYMIKMKKAAATCMRKDAPELDLPLFNNEFRLASVLTKAPRIGQQSSGMQKMMKAFMQMQMLSQLMDDDSPRSFVKRAADDEFDLGSKLQEKLAMKKEDWEAQYGNITCMLRECDILDSKDKFNPEGIKKEGTKWAKKLEQHFGSVEKLEDETNIPAEQLFMLVREMLKGPEVDMMMNMVKAVTATTTKI